MYKVYGNTVIVVFLTLASSVPLTFDPFKRVIQEVKYFTHFSVRSVIMRRSVANIMSHNRILVTVCNIIFVSACIFSTDLLVR